MEKFKESSKKYVEPYKLCVEQTAIRDLRLHVSLCVGGGDVLFKEV